MRACRDASELWLPVAARAWGRESRRGGNSAFSRTRRRIQCTGACLSGSLLVSQEGRADVAAVLLEHRADPNLSDFAVRRLAKLWPASLPRQFGSHTGFHLAAALPREEHSSGLRSPYLNPPRPRASSASPLLSPQGWVPLHYAANHRWASWGSASIDGQLSLVQLLASRGADMAARSLIPAPAISSHSHCLDSEGRNSPRPPRCPLPAPTSSQPQAAHDCCSLPSDSLPRSPRLRRPTPRGTASCTAPCRAVRPRQQPLPRLRTRLAPARNRRRQIRLVPTTWLTPACVSAPPAGRLELVRLLFKLGAPINGVTLRHVVRWHPNTSFSHAITASSHPRPLRVFSPASQP